MRAENALLRVQLVDDNVAKVLERARPRGVVRKDAGVEHVRVREDHVRPLAELARRALGQHIFDRYIEIKRKEWDEYRIQLTPWEMEKYLAVL